MSRGRQGGMAGDVDSGRIVVVRRHALDIGHRPGGRGVRLDASVGSRVLLFVSGALSAVLDVLAFRNFGEGYAVLLLAIWIGVGFIFQGLSETAVAISHRLLPARGWHIFLGILTVIAGVVVLAWPFDSIVVLAIVAGAWLVNIGITQIIWAFQARKDTRTIERSIEQLTSPN